MLPGHLAKRVDTLQAHVDTALSISDLLGMEDEAGGFTGRSWFRKYSTPRKVFAGNTYLRSVIMWQPAGAVVCDESFRDCNRYGYAKGSMFSPRRRGTPAAPRERRLLAEVARLTRSGRPGMTASETMALLTVNEARVPAGEGKKLLSGGQYLRVPDGTTLRVDFDLEVEGNDVVVELHQDVFLNGYEKFARKAVQLRDEERWRLSYEIGVPKESSQLVVQLYATTVAGDEATIRFHEAKLSMRRSRGVVKRTVVVIDEVSPSPPR